MADGRNPLSGGHNSFPHHTHAKHPTLTLFFNKLTLVERLIAIQGSNRAFCDTSMKFGTQVEQAEANILRNRAIADLAHGCHGNHFKVLFFTKTHKT